MVDKEIIEIIEDTDLEYVAYCKGKDCMPELCAIKRNRKKIYKDDEIDCLILFTLYKLGIDQEEIIKDVNEEYKKYCYKDKICASCKLFDFKYKNFDHDILPYCRSCYVILYMNNMLDLIEERK